jgi:FemAB-related protein (PEP-CTERM system-associated)
VSGPGVGIAPAAPARSLQVARLDGPDAAWDEFVSAAPDSSFCHLAGWGSLMRALGHEYVPLVATSAAGIEGVLPLVRMRSALFGHRLISMPFLNYGGPVGAHAARARLVNAAVTEARRSGALLELRCRHPAVSGLSPSQPKVLATMPLPESADALWSSFPSKLRSQVRRAQREDMEVRFGHDQVPAFHTVFARNMRDLGTPVQGRGFFEAIAARFSEALCGVVYWQGEPVAAGLGLTWRGEFEMTWASSLREHSARAPNMLLYWSFMAETIRRGADTFNFGRSTPGAGTHRFKLQWGSVETPLCWVEWPERPDAASRSRPAAATLASEAWRRLPLALANVLGPALARRLPWW